MSHSYYEHHGEFVKASNLMSLLAHAQEEVDIEVRIACLQKAVASAEKAVHSTATPFSSAAASSSANRGDLVVFGESGGASKQMISDSLAELKDTLDIADYQLLAYTRLSADFASYHYSSAPGSGVDRLSYTESQRRQLDLMERIVRRLRGELLGITELFHEVCLAYKLWDVCLLLLHISRHDDHDMVARLWRSFIYRYVCNSQHFLQSCHLLIYIVTIVRLRLVPESGLTEETNAFLRAKRDAQRIDVDRRLQTATVPFDSSEQWLPTLQRQVLQLAQALQGSQASTAFPVHMVLEELEDISAALAACGAAGAEKGWATSILREVGLSHGALVECYMELFDQWAGRGADKLLHVVTCTTALLLSWTQNAMQ